MKQVMYAALLLGSALWQSQVGLAALNIGGSRGLHVQENTCVGYCEPKNIICDQDLLKQGSYLWCRQNCVAKDQPNHAEYVRALRKCERKFNKAQPDKAEHHDHPEKGQN